jgi:hypothetical protein
MKKITFILLISLFGGFMFSVPASAQDKSGEKKDAKTAKAANDSNDLEWVEEVAHRAYILSEEAARRAESLSRDMERRMYHHMEQTGRRGQMRMEHRDTCKLKGYYFPGNLDSLELSGFNVPEMKDMPHFPDMADMPTVRDYMEMDRHGNFHNMAPLHGFMFSDSKSGSSWSYERRLNEATFTTEYSAATDETAKKVDLYVSGVCTKGSITISVTSPDGKKLSDIVIDENGNMNWRKSYNTEETKWTKGNWTFKVTTKSATGTYNISLDSF